jgi:hypothetical protein
MSVSENPHSCKLGRKKGRKEGRKEERKLIR